MHPAARRRATRARPRGCPAPRRRPPPPLRPPSGVDPVDPSPSGGKIEAQYPLATVLPPAVLSTPAHGQLPAPTIRRSWAGSITGTIAVDSSAPIEFWPTTARQSSGTTEGAADKR